MIKNETYLIAVALILIIYIFATSIQSPVIDTPKDPLITKIEQAEGKPVIVQTVKFGDDKSPNYVRTYCQLLPFKRSVGDNQIFCWAERLK